MSDPDARRALRDLEQQREAGLRELGSLAMQMHRREKFQLEVLEAHAKDLARIETKIHELDPVRGDTES